LLLLILAKNIKKYIIFWFKFDFLLAHIKKVTNRYLKSK